VGDSKVQIPDEWFEGDSSSDESQIISKHERSHRRHNSKDVDAPVIDLLRCSDRQIRRLERRFHDDKRFSGKRPKRLRRGFGLVEIQAQDLAMRVAFFVKACSFWSQEARWLLVYICSSSHDKLENLHKSGEDGLEFGAWRWGVRGLRERCLVPFEWRSSEVVSLEKDNDPRQEICRGCHRAHS